jgi:transcriptional regulator with XRE-family HTH domain
MSAQLPSLSAFPKRVKARREELEMTQAALSVKVGVAPDSGTVSKWETGEREPEELTTLMRLAQALHVSTDWLLGMPDAAAPPKPRLKASHARKLVRHATEIVAALIALAPDDEDAEPSPLPARDAQDHQGRAQPAAAKRAPRRGDA